MAKLYSVAIIAKFILDSIMTQNKKMCAHF